MALVKEPDMIVCNFLRSWVDEPTRVGQSNRQSSTSEAFAGDGSTAIFYLGAGKSTVAVKQVVVDGVVQKMYQAYDIDLDTGFIEFGTAPSTSVVTAEYFMGSSWIFPDMPRDDLGKTSFPRVGAYSLSENGSIRGIGSTKRMINNVVFQIDCLGFKDQEVLFSGASTSVFDNKVTNTLSRSVIKAVKQNSTAMNLALHTPEFLNNFSVPFDENIGVFRRTIELRLTGEDVGE